MKLEQVTPSPTVQDGLDSRVTYTVFPSQLGARYSLSRMVLRRPARGADFAYLLLCQFSSLMLFTNWMKSMLIGVFHIAAVRHPFKILKTVVSPVPVLVVGNVTWWARTDESLKD